MQLLRDLDYNIIDWFYTAVALDLPSADPKNVVMRIPRRLLYSIIWMWRYVFWGDIGF
jgi:hypothetical protein